MAGHVVTLGETMGLVRTTAIGSLEHVSDLALHVGGAESNVAIGVVRMGGRATWIGRVGDDSLGRRVLRELRGEQVDVAATVDDSARTGLMLKETPTAGTTRVLYYRAASAGSRLSPGDLDADTIRTADLLHVTGITLALSESAAAAVHDAVGIARSAGVPVSFDVNHRASLWADRDAADAYREIARQADIVFAGDGEAELLVGPGEPEDLAAALAALGPTQAVVKLGERGCVARIDGIPVLGSRRSDHRGRLGGRGRCFRGRLPHGTAGRRRPRRATAAGEPLRRVRVPRPGRLGEPAAPRRPRGHPGS